MITGDANLSETSTWLKVGTAAWVLRVVEAGMLGTDLRLAAPVAAMRQVSHDLSCRGPLDLADGRRMSACEIQQVYLDACRKLLADPAADDLPAAGRDEAEELFAAWQEVLDLLGTDITALADRLDWVAKLTLMQSYRQRDGLSWDSPKLALIDLQYADVDPARSLYAALAAKGKIRRLVTDAEIEQARLHPPNDTRAYFRGRVMEKFGASVVAASWDSVIFDLPGRESLQRVPTIDPLRGTRAHVGELIDRSDSAQALVAAITR